MLKKTFIICSVVLSLISTSYLCASQPETEFTVPAAPPAPEEHAATEKTPAAVTRQSSIQDTRQALALHMQKIRAANADEEELENESDNKEADAVQFQLLEAKTLKLKSKVRTLKEQLKTAEAHGTLNELDSEAKELETAELRENIKILELKLTRAEEEETRYQEKLAENVDWLFKLAERLEDRENSQLALREEEARAARAALEIRHEKFWEKEKRVTVKVEQAEALCDLARAHLNELSAESAALQKRLAELGELDAPYDTETTIESKRCLEKADLLFVQIPLAYENVELLTERYCKAVQKKSRLAKAINQLREEHLRIVALENDLRVRFEEYKTMIIENNRLLENTHQERQG